jgi:hypothetical protein
MKFLSYMMRGLVAVLIASGCGLANAEERLYGSFIYNSDIPNALFFMDEIKNGDDFELRKALRNHDVDTIVLASPGGSVWAGLSMAGECPTDIIDQIGGWSRKGVGESYGRGYQVEQLWAWMVRAVG